MREIKLRAWHKILKRMIVVSQIDFTLEIIVFFDNITNDLGYVKFKDIELMLFTRISDEQNIEIYEDDIVKFSVKDFNEVVGYLERDIVGTVKFDAGSFYIEYLDDHKKTMSLPFNSDILISVHVIGNVHKVI